MSILPRRKRHRFQLLGGSAIGPRYAPFFDGIAQYGELAYRAINVDEDIDIEFYTPESIAVGVQQVIIGQAISTSQQSKEFEIFVSAGTGNLGLTVGGASTAAALAGNYLPSTRYRIFLSGDTLETYEGGTLVRSITFVRGTVREPQAKTYIATRAESPSTYFSGFQYDVKINGTTWPMNERNQAIQLPSPDGLGDELITPTVLENPASKGSQWTYLGDGRWQLIGDGSLSVLRFISTDLQPESGYLEFEIESITGGSIFVLFESGEVGGNKHFSTTGKKRFVYTTKQIGQAIEFKRSIEDPIVSCIIKNISFKPLGTCNPLTIINHTDAMWQEVS